MKKAIIAVSNSILMCAICLSLFLNCTFCFAQTPPESKDESYKLHAIKSDFGTIPRIDSIYHFESGQAFDAYANGKLADAEKHYRAALKAVEQEHVQEEPHVMLLANLASVLRDEHKYEESTKLFGQAVEISRQHLQSRQPVLDYVAQQYSALLRKEGKDFEASAIKDSARNGFKIATIQQPIDATIGQKHSTKTKMCKYKIIVEPDPADIGWDLAKGSLTWRPVVRINGGFQIFRVVSGFRPFIIKAPIPYDTPVYARECLYTEITYIEGETKPFVYKSHFPSLCDFQRAEITGEAEWHGKVFSDDVIMEIPAESGPCGSSMNLTRWE